LYRTSIAVLHFNENVKRETKRSATGEKYYSVTYPKFKNGGEVVRERKVPSTFSMYLLPIKTALTLYLFSSFLSQTPLGII